MSLLNNVRTLAAHRYGNDTGEAMTRDQQVLDSVSITSRLFTPLVAPVGLRFHALHHLFPSVP